MRIFVAGASGVIGRRLVPMLVAAGHDVVGMTRSAERAEVLREAGAEPAVCDVFDAEALRRTVAAAQPEVVVHELTDLPQNLDPRRAKEAYERNDRIRREGTSNLVAAAVACGARRIVAQSIAFVYRPEGDAVKDEDAPMWDDAPEPFTDSVAAVRQLEEMVVNADGIDGLALRYGFFYGPGTRLRGRRVAGRDGAQAPLPGARQGRRCLLVHPHRRRRRGDGGCGRARGARYLQRRRRRARRGARLAAGLCRGRRRQAAPAATGMARATGGRQVHGRDGDGPARSVEREGQARSWAGSRNYASWRQGFREALG